MTQIFRLATGGRIDRSRPITFTFNGKRFEGYSGDTLASALLANGVHLVGRSFKFHRPRGIFAIGADEPNGLVQLGDGPRSEPNSRGTQIELYQGLVASSQNCWPSVRFDVGAVNDWLSRLIPAGFYYKTFMWPAGQRWWLRYEHAIRRIAGMGRVAKEAARDRYEHRYAHCDVLVIGGGAAGLAAALGAASEGVRVLLCEQEAELGCTLRSGTRLIDGEPASAWVERVSQKLAENPEVRVLCRTTAFGYYDQNMVGLVERVADHLSEPVEEVPRQRIWYVRARRVVLASGALERSIAYAGNDLPGTLLAGAAAGYVSRFAVKPGTRAVVFTNNDYAYDAALTLHRAGVNILAIVDVRPPSRLVGDSYQRARTEGLTVFPEAMVSRSYGNVRVTAVDITPVGGTVGRRIPCDLVCVSGGWNPTIHLFSQAQGKLRYDEALATFVPEIAPSGLVVVGAANGRMSLAAALADGHSAGVDAASLNGLASRLNNRPPVSQDEICAPVQAFWAVPNSVSKGKRFVDLQNDVTVDDIELAAREGYRSVEHLKRYTTLGMGTDQGKTSNVLGLALLAEMVHTSIPSVGTTTFRAPYTPVRMAAFAGSAVNAEVQPTRYSAMHEWHVKQSAHFVNSGLWKRPHSYPRHGETPEDAASREARNVRVNVGIVDVSTLGKIELQGRDVTTFLDRLYANRFETLRVGRCRYGIMLRTDGALMDDGTVSRLSETNYLLTTTTVNAVRVMQHIEYLLQVAWTELQVFAASVTEQWAAIALSGPHARKVLAKLVDADVSNAAFPFLAVCQCSIRTPEGTVPVRLFRISFSGELAYEIHVSADHGTRVWEALIDAGEEFGLMPYGTEAMATLRIEKGHVVVGAEADGRVTAEDLGLGQLVNGDKWCVGKPLLGRPALAAPGRWQLVGLTAMDGARAFPRGAKLISEVGASGMGRAEGHVTSWCWSPNLEAAIGLGLLANGRDRIGETLYAVAPLTESLVKVQVGSACFVDPEGKRVRA